MRAPIRVAVPSLSAGERVLDREASHYVVRVHRVGAGDRFIAFDPVAKLEAEATLIEADHLGARCIISAPVSASNVAATQITVIQALGKGDKLDRVVRDATALGASRIVFVETARAVVRLGDRGAARLDRWKKIAIEAARQSGRGDTPQLVGPLSLAEAFQQTQSIAMRLCFDPRASETYGAALDAWRPATEIALLVGPEGGLDDHELALAERCGYRRVRFGSFILRTETALTAALGALVAFGSRQ